MDRAMGGAAGEEVGKFESEAGEAGDGAAADGGGGEEDRGCISEAHEDREVLFARTRWARDGDAGKVVREGEGRGRGEVFEGVSVGRAAGEFGLERII